MSLCVAGREGVVGALAGDGEGHLVPLAVRRERPGRLSRRELEREAEAVLRQADRVHCTPALTPDKFSTLPPRPRPKHSGKFALLCRVEVNLIKCG